MAFSWKGEGQDNSDIYVKLIGVEPPLRLTTNPAGLREQSPPWSPDGRWIAFLRVLPALKASVILISPIGGPERVLTEIYFDPINFDGRSLPGPRTPVGSQWLTLTSPSKQWPWSLYSVETGERRRLTSPPENSMGDSCPAFSPDGRTLAFFRKVTWSNSNLFLLDLSQDLKPVAGPRRLTFESWLAMSPAWNTDGKSLIFVAWSGGNSSLWRVAASGTGKPQRLIAIGADGASPAVSRRGNRLVYTEVRGNWHIWRMEIPVC